MSSSSEFRGTHPIRHFPSSAIDFGVKASDTTLREEEDDNGRDHHQIAVMSALDPTRKLNETEVGCSWQRMHVQELCRPGEGRGRGGHDARAVTKKMKVSC